MRTVGVLGGMGPEATVYFMQRIIAAVAAKDDADHVPLLVDNNTQVPSRIARILKGRGDDPAPVLIQMAQRLVAAGADALVMPCNTAHFYAADLAGATAKPFLNMVDMACTEAARIAPNGKVGLLGSPALQQVGVYAGALAKAGLTPVHASDNDRVLATIRSIKSQGPSDVAARALTDVAAEMVHRGADVLCVCCTEFSMLAGQIRSAVPMFDAMDLLVQETVRFSTAEDPSDVIGPTSATVGT